MILYDYSYDLVHQPFFTKVLDEDHNKILIKFIIPKGVNALTGIKVKLAKAGNPGPVYYGIGTTMGGDNIASGLIEPEQVLPVFEAFVAISFKEVSVSEGNTFFLTLRCSSGKLPLDGYRVFGPCQWGGEEFDKAELPPYWWDEKYCHGMAVPKYYKPSLYEKSSLVSIIENDGSDGPGISFGICTDIASDEGCEQRFEFIKELTASPYSEWKSIQSENNTAVAVINNEVILDGKWGVIWDIENKNTILTDKIGDELKAFFSQCFSIDLKGADKSIVFKIGEDGVPSGKESHVVDVDDNRIVITARNDRGLLRAVHYLEDIMLERRAPAIRKGVHERKSLYEVRMTNGIYPAGYNYFTLESPGIWTDGYIWRLSRAGYNALWVLVCLEELVEDSRALPELNDSGANTALKRLERITEKASEFGVDVYIELRTGYLKYFDESVYERLPHLRTFPKWGNYPCTGSAEFKELLTESVTNMLKRAPKLKGIIIIYDTEGFYSCFINNRQENCPICRSKSSDVLAEELFSTLISAMKSQSNEAELIAWTYYCDEPWNYKLIQKLPRDIKILACFSQFMKYERFGVENRTDDYAVSVTGPSEYFEDVYKIAESNGFKLLTKTEVSFGQEFLGIPYNPCLTQHQKRWDALNNKPLHGFMGDYIHRGFMPSPCTDLMRLNIYETNIDGSQWLNSEEKLLFTASMNYGKHIAEDIVKAWDVFSAAISEYFPYSPGVCRFPGPLQAGPSQPFYLDKSRTMKRSAARYNSADLSWTESNSYGQKNTGWDDKLIYKCFENFKLLYLKGISRLEAIIGGDSAAINKVKLVRELNIAKMQACMISSMNNFIDFVRLRDQLGQVSENMDIYLKIKDICEKERDNATEGLYLCSADSSLGFACEGQGTVRGGYFTPATIREKLDELALTLREIKDILNK